VGRATTGGFRSTQSDRSARGGPAARPEGVEHGGPLDSKRDSGRSDSRISTIEPRWGGSLGRRATHDRSPDAGRGRSTLQRELGLRATLALLESIASGAVRSLRRLRPTWRGAASCCASRGVRPRLADACWSRPRSACGYPSAPSTGRPIAIFRPRHVRAWTWSPDAPPCRRGSSPPAEPTPFVEPDAGESRGSGPVFRPSDPRLWSSLRSPARVCAFRPEAHDLCRIFIDRRPGRHPAAGFSPSRRVPVEPFQRSPIGSRRPTSDGRSRCGRAVRGKVLLLHVTPSYRGVAVADADAELAHCT